jgi:hypothetical protein
MSRRGKGEQTQQALLSPHNIAVDQCADMPAFTSGNAWHAREALALGTNDSVIHFTGKSANFSAPWWFPSGTCECFRFE